MEWRFVTTKSPNKPQGARVGVEVSTFSEILVGAETGPAAKFFVKGQA